MESLLKKVNKEKVAQYHTYLESLDLSAATIKRRLSSLRKFTEWAEKEGYLEEIAAERAPITKETPLPKAALFKNLRPTFPPFSYLQKAYITYHSISITRYLHYGILVVFCAALGFGLYQQLTGPKAKLAEAYPTSLTRPNRYLSFQGRLTDSSDNPITSLTNFVFKLYDTAGSGTPPTGGVQLWTSGNCSVDPDEDGIFSVLLGSDCGSEIAATVFSENAGVWVQITVGTSPSDETLSPRIRVATVGYALNAETLQGYPPGTGASMVPYIDSTGKITIAAASPTIESTSGTFAIKGRALSITTATGTNGNITIAPDGIGTLNINVGGTGPGSQVRITDANMVSGNLVSIYAGTNATGFDLLNLSSGSTETTKFSVDESGNTYVAGNLGVGTTDPGYKLDVQGGDFNVSGNLYTSGTQRLSSAGALSNITGYTQASGAFSFSGGGNFSVDSAGFDVTTGGAISGVTTLSMNNQLTNSYANTAAINLTGAGAGITFGSSGPYQIITGGSADLALMPGGNLGIGTTGPSQKLHIDGNMRLTGALYDLNNQAGTSGQILSTTVSGVDWVDISSVGVGGTGTINYLPKWLSSSTLGNSLLYENGTNVGIGTTSPGQLLELYKLSGDPAVVFDIGGTDKFTLGVDDSVNDIFKIETGGSLTSTATPPFAITSGGNVGIGTTAPTGKLQVSGGYVILDKTKGFVLDGYVSGRNRIWGVSTSYPDYGFSYYESTPDYIGFHLSGDPNNSNFGISGAGSVSIGNILFRQALDVTGNAIISGNVGIGATSPSYHLDVRGGSSGGAALYVEANNTSNSTGAYLTFDGNSYHGSLTVYGSSTLGSSAEGDAGLFLAPKTRAGGWASIFVDESDSQKLYIKTGGYGAKAGTGTLVIDSSGNVGIGTTNPGAKLDINGNLKIGTVASISDNNQVLTVDSGIVKYIDTSSWDKSSSDDYGAWWLAGDSGTAQSIGAGNTASIIGGVGIGTTASATDTLTVGVNQAYNFAWTGNQSWAGTSTFNNLVDLNNILDLDANDASNYAANIAQTGNGGGLFVSNTGTNLSFRVDDQASDTSPFAIDQYGNVGIGTSSPAAKLTVGNYLGADATYKGLIQIAGASVTGDTDFGLEFKSSTYQSGYGWRLITPDNGTTLPLVFQSRVNNASWTNRLVINSGTGYVGIGTTAPDNLLSLNKSSGDPLLDFRLGDVTKFSLGVDDSDSDKFKIETGATLGGATAPFVIDSSGNVGIGTTSPGVTLDVDGIVRASGNVYSGGYWGFVFGSSVTEGELIYRLGNDIRVQAGGSDRVHIDGDTGNVGIGTTNPGAKLDIAGNLKIGTVASVADNNQVLTVDSGIVKYIDTSSWDKSSGDDYGAWWLAGNTGTAQSIGAGNTASIVGGVGIGTTASATDTLTVGVNQGYNFAWTGNQSWAGTSTFNGLVDINNILDLDANDASLYAANIAQTGNGGGLYVSNTGSGTSFRVDDQASDLSPFIIDASGNVGIGTTGPSSALDVIGTITTQNASGQDRLFINSYYSGSNPYIYQSTSNSHFLRVENISSGALGMTVEGSVGIGTTGPASPLHIYENNSGTAQSTGLTIEQNGSGDAIAQFLLTGSRRWVVGVDNSDSDKFKFATDADLATNAVLTIDTSGNVGIGTTGPGAILHVNTGGQATLNTLTGQIFLQASGSAGTGNYGPGIVFSQADGSTSGNHGASIASIEEAPSDANRIGLTFNVHGSASADPRFEAMRISHYGNVGIGTTNPGAKLDINGNLKIGTVASVSDNNQVLTVDSGIVKYIDTSSWDKSSADDYGAWWLAGDTGTAQNIGAGNTASIIGGVGIGTTASATDTLTVGVNQAYNFAWTGNQSWAGTSTFNGLVDLNNILDLDANDASLYAANIAQTGNGGGLYVSNTGSGTSFRVDDAASDLSPFIIDSGGNVGIGTTGPGEKLDVGGNILLSAGATSPGAALKINNGGYYDQFGMTQGWEAYWTSNATYTGTQWNYVNTGGYSGLATKLTNSAGTFTFSTASNASNPVVWNDRLTILNSGNVGIGTTSPTSLLSLYKTNDGSTAEFIKIQSSGTSGNTGSSIGFYESSTEVARITALDMGGNQGLTFNTRVSSVNEAMRITGAGNVGIGTTGPGVKFEVSEPTAANLYTYYRARGGNSLVSGSIFLVNDSGGNAKGASIGSDGSIGGGLVLAGDSGGTGAANADMFIQNGGNVGIGTTNPGAKLDINGNLKIGTVASVADNNQVLTVDSGIVKYIDTSSWDKSSSDDYGAWWLAGNSGTAQSIGAGNTASILGGVGIGTTASATDTLTVGVNQAYNFAWTGLQTWSQTATFNGSIDLNNILDLDANDASLYAANIAQIGNGGGLYVSNTGSGTSFRVDDASSDLSPFIIDASGNVGIGTTGPSYKLDVGGTIRNQNQLFVHNDVYTKKESFIDSGSTSQGKWYKLMNISTGTGSTYRTIGYKVNVKYYSPTEGPGYNVEATINLRVHDTSRYIGWIWEGKGISSYLKLQKYPDSNTFELYAYSPYNYGMFETIVGWSGEGATDSIVVPSLEVSAVEIADPNQGTAVTQSGNYIYPSGNVGIGTTAPGAKLGFAAATTAAGGIDFGGDVNLYRSAANSLKTDDNFYVGGGNLFVGTDVQIVRAAASTADVYAHWRSGTDNNYDLGGTSNSWKNLYLGGTAYFGIAEDTNLYRVVANQLGTDDSFYVAGNVGIGTTNPGAKLDINGNLKIGTVASVADNNQVLTVDSGIVKYINTSSWDKNASDDGGNWILAGNEGTPQNIGAGDTASFLGGIGIGTTASATDILNIHVNQAYNFAWTGNQSWAGSADFNGDVSIADSSIALDNATSTNLAVTGDFSINTSQFFLEKSTGEIGIGTASPGQLLELYKASGDPAMVFDIGGTDKFTLGVDDSVSDIFKIETGGSLTATTTPPFVINSSGNVGIGTSGPSYKLHVEGSSTTPILYVKNIGTTGTPNAIEGHSAEVGSAVYNAGYLGGYDNTYALKWFGARGTTKSGVAVLGQVLDSGTGFSGLFLGGGGVGIGSSSFSPGAHMLDVESTKGTTGNSAIRAQYYQSGIGGQEFGAIASRGNQWNAIYGKQGSGGAALYTEGEVNMISGNVGIGTTVPTHKLELESHTTATGGIALGTDIELYREAANVLRMAQDDTLSLWGGAAANGIQRFQVTGDTVPRLTIQAGGTLSWGAGGASAQDTDLYRDSANKLRTSDTLIVDGNVGIGTTGPGAALHVKGSSSNALRLEGSSPDELADLYVGGDGRLIISTTPGSDSLGMIDFRSEDDLFGYVFRDSSGAVTTTYLNMYVVDTTTDYVNFVINSGNGTTGLVLDDNNNVGIGITGPNAKLEIMGTSEQLRLAYNGSNYVSFTIGNDGDLLVKPTGTGQVKFQPTTNSATFFQVLNAAGSAATPILNIDTTSERVGIGTSAPGAKLDIAGASSTISNTSGDITIDAASNNISFAGDNLINVGEITAAKLMDSASSSYYIDPAASGTSLYVNGDIALGMTSTNDDDYIYFDTSTNEYLAWDDDPGQFVISDDFVPNADDTFNLGSNTARWADLYLGPGTIHLGSSTADEYTIGYDTTNNRLEFNVNGSGPAEMVMDSSGNVGIGTTGPWGKLTISGDYSTGNGRTNQLIITGEGSNFQDRNLYIGINTTYDYASIAYVNEGDHWGPLVLQEGGGNVGIGTTSPDTALDVGSGAVKAGNGYALGTRQGSNYRIDVGTTSVSCANVTWVGIQYTWSVAFSSTPKCLTTGHGGGNWLSYHLAGAGCSTTYGQHNIYQGSGSAQTCTAQILGYGPTTMTDFDLAEGYKTKDQTIESGEVVCIDPENNSHIVKCAKPYDATAIGIVSTEPGLIIGDELTPNSRLVGLQGRVPVKVTLENGPIERGDPLTPSATKPGFAMKAKKAGQIIGKALQPFNGTSTVLGENAFDGLSEENITEIMRETGETGEGQTMAFINVSWYDPDAYLTDTGELNISRIEANQEQIDTNERTYKLTDSSGSIITRVGAFAEAAIAELQTGLINAQEIITEKLTSQEVNTQKLITPLVETQEIDTQRISLSEIDSKPGEDVIINLTQDESQSEFGKLVVKGADGTEVATIDAQGNASFSGELTASKSKFGQLLAEEITSESLEVSQDATIAGTLYAKKIVAEEIVGLESKFGKLLAATVSATYITQNITNITQIIEPSPSPEPTISEEPSATDSGELLSDEEVEELVNQILGTSLEATPQANLAEVYGDSLTINEGLTVLGTTSLADTTIAGSLNVGATMTLADNSLNTLTGPLYLQNLGLGGIDILAGKITIDEQGNAVFGADVTIKGRLALSEIEPLPEQENLVVDLSPETEGESRFGKLLFKGVNNEIVASVDASGSAFFTSLGLEADYSATESGAIIAAYDNYLENGYYSPAIETNATAGIGILPAGETEIQIYNPNITEQSLIYLVPTSDTKNKVLFVKAKHGYKEAVVDEYGQEVVPAEKGWFKAAIDTSITKEVRFNWWIVGGSE